VCCVCVCVCVCVCGCVCVCVCVWVYVCVCMSVVYIVFGVVADMQGAPGCRVVGGVREGSLV
jgi:hypothetical protein